MKIKTYATWKFEELDDNLKEKVLDNYRYFNVEDSYWYDYDGKMGFSESELKKLRINLEDSPEELITWQNLYFSIDREWYIQFIGAKFTDSEFARRFLRVPANIWNRVSWSFENYRDITTKLTYEWEGNKELTKRQEMILDRACKIFSDKAEKALKDLRDNYEYLMTDEAVKESLIANDYDFDENGKIA